MDEAAAALRGAAAAVAAHASAARGEGDEWPSDEPMSLLVVDAASGAAKRAKLTRAWRTKPCSELARLHGLAPTAVDVFEGGVRVDGAARIARVFRDGSAAVLRPRDRLRDGALLVPASMQLAVYDGVRAAPRYVAHRDNDQAVMGDGENHREVTLILYPLPRRNIFLLSRTIRVVAAADSRAHAPR